jgi:hypothetical protein
MSEAKRAALVTGASLLMVGNIPPSEIPAETHERLRNLLASEKTTLFLLHPACLGDWIREPAVASLLPVRGVVAAPDPVDSPWTFRLPGGDAEAAGIPVYNLYRVEPSNPQAVKFSAVNPKHGKAPLLLNRDRVTCLMSPATWRWFLHPDRQVRFDAALFWSHLLERYSGLERRGIALHVEPADSIPFPPSRRIWRCVVDDSSGNTADSHSLFLMRERGKALAEEVVRFSPVAADGRSFQCRIGPESPGIHWFFAEKRDSGNRVLDRSPRVPIHIPDENRELLTLSDRTSFLERIAEYSGGRVWKVGEIDGLLRELAKPRLTLVGERRPVYDFPRESILTGIVLFLLFLEWFLRQAERRGEYR